MNTAQVTTEAAISTRSGMTGDFADSGRMRRYAVRLARTLSRRERIMPMVRSTVTGAVIFALCGISGWVFGQEASNPAFIGNKVTPIIKADVTGAPTKQVIANIYEVPAGAVVPRHFHHGDEFHYVLSGEWAAEVEGRPTRTLKEGDGQYVENGRWHGGKVIGDAPLRLLGLMIVDKDQPITTMVK